MRPNQIFTAPLLDERTRAAVVREVTTQLTYPYGVASLSARDPDFHPFHQFPPYYPKDAAYHNGTVWTWVQGALISELCYFGRQDVAYLLTQSTVDQILRRGAVGTQSELLDAVPREGETEPRLSGTFSQAWNLAEFIRNVYDDYLGIRVNRFDHQLSFHPRIPGGLGDVQAVINIGGRTLPVSVTSQSGEIDLRIDGNSLRVGGSATVTIPYQSSDQIATFDFMIPPQSEIRLVENSNGALLTKGEDVTQINPVVRTIPGARSLLHLPFAVPQYSDNLNVLKGPAYPLIPHATVITESSESRSLVSATDPPHDDNGNGHYTYPLNPNFLPGSFDITEFEVRHNAELLYFRIQFRTLSDPGWHPEYGFQLTQAAIAIGPDEEGARDPGHNSQMLVDLPFERLVIIGGGIQVEDGTGTIIAAYLPGEEDSQKPFGDAASGTIRFALPIEYFGTSIIGSRFVVMAGGQDDHGGAGLGEFRTVGRKATEWSGGGKEDPEGPNIYDILVVGP